MSPDERSEEVAGIGPLAVVAVLGPVLAGTATMIFLATGYLLKMFDPEPASRPGSARRRLGLRRDNGGRDPGRRGQSAAHRPANLPADEGGGA